MPKIKEREKAINLRKSGYSYTEILRKVPVAKSTLSLWLRSIGLSKRQKQRLTKKKLAAMKRGWESCHKRRLKITGLIKNEAQKEIGRISRRDLWMIGIALYWAEGHKEKTKSSLVELGNLDPYLIKIFLKWLRKICKIPKKDINFWLFIHETARKRLSEVQKYWAKATGFTVENFQKVSWKKHKINTKRKNIGENYYGLLRIIVKRSVNLNRKIAGWIEGICK